MKKNVILFMMCLFGLQLANAQSPWTREKGKAYVQLGFSGIFYNQAEIDGTTSDLVYDYSDVTIQLYSEFGITNNLEAQFILPYKSVSYKPGERVFFGGSGDFSAIGNLTLGLKYKIYDKDWKISTGLQYLPKTSKYDEKSGLSSGFNASILVPYISAGSSSGKWYYYGNLGYGYMDNNYSDYIQGDIEVGYTVIPRGHIIFAFNSKNPIAKESAYTNDPKQWFSYLDRQTYNAVGLKLNYEFSQDKFGANFSAFGAFGNDNAPLAPSLNLGVYSKF